MHGRKGLFLRIRRIGRRAHGSHAVARSSFLQRTAGSLDAGNGSVRVVVVVAGRSFRGTHDHFVGRICS